MRIFNVVASLLAVGFAAQAFAEEGAVSTAQSKGFGYSNGPEAATLPEGVARFRLPYQIVTGNTTYDKDGNKSESPAKVSATGGSVIAEYGLTNKLSFQMRVDYRKSQKIEMAGNRLWENAAYSQAISASAELTALNNASKAYLGGPITGKDSLINALLLSQSKCNSAATCATFRSQTDAVSVGTVQAVTTRANTTDDNIFAAVKAQSEFEGNAALGDTIVGLLYNLAQDENYWAAVGVGVRLPTGTRNLAATEQDTTRSAYELGVRVDFDYLPSDWFTLSVEDQMELPLAGTKRKVGGVEREIKRKGVRNVGFVALKPSLHVLHPAMNAVKTQAGVKFDYDNGELTTSNGTTTGGSRTTQMWKYVTLGYSFLHSMQVPVQFDVDYEVPHSGQNVTLATTKTTATLKAFAKF